VASLGMHRHKSSAPTQGDPASRGSDKKERVFIETSIFKKNIYTGILGIF